MSRLERLKNRRKRILKATISSLAITLVIGSTHVIPTYAWLASNANVDSGLALTTGTMGLNVGKGFDISETNIENKIKTTFDISNIGSLKQKSSLNFELIKNELSPGLLSKINYTLELTYNEKVLVPISGNLENLIEQNIDISYENGEQVILNPNEIIKCNAVIDISHPQVSQALKGKSVEFNLNIVANQTNLKDKGFMATYSQSNKINILDKNEVKPVLGVCDCGGCNELNAVILNFGKVPGLEGKDIQYFRLPEEGNNGLEEFSIHQVKNNNNLYLVKNNEEVGHQLTLEELKGKVFTIDLGGPGITGYLRYSVEFIGDNAENMISKWTYIENVPYELELQEEEEEVPSEPEVVEPPKEEVEVPSEPEVVEPPKEEEEVPSEPEIVEPPKEEVEMPTKPEAVEPPKVEETVVTSQPDIIAPSKEETEIQE